MKRLHLHHLGRLGNMMCAYSFARGFCEVHGIELHTDPWIGETIFQIEHPRCSDVNWPRMDETNLDDMLGEDDVSYRSYSQCQKCADYYTLTQLREWFKFRPEIEAMLKLHLPTPDHCCAHRRVGDFAGYGYAVVSVKSYELFARIYGIPEITWITEESSTYLPDLPKELEMLPDFWRLMRCKVLLRGNSTFSWMAACLNADGKIFSPVIDGLPGGREHDVGFVSGNHPRLSNHSFVTDMRVSK